MKRCPKCEFLYYDAQDRCDMDGTRLRFTTKLPTLPAEAAQKKSLRGAITILVLVTIVLSVVLFILYPPHWRTSTMSHATEVAPANVPNENADSQLPVPEASQHITSTPLPKPATPSRDPFAPMETNAEKANSSLAATKANATMVDATNRSTETKPAMHQVTTVNQGAPIIQKPTTPSYSTSNPTPRPVAVATATPKPVTQNSNKDSKFNSFMKKTGRLLKKPF